MAMTTPTGTGPGIKRGFGRLVRFLFGAMFVVQTVRVAFALRRKRAAREDRAFGAEPIVAN
jgi:hypothetical protein